jgi:hypothetical protein
VADRLEALYTRVGVPTRLRQLDIPRNDLRNIANDTVKNFNANAGVRSAEDQIEDALRLLNPYLTSTKINPTLSDLYGLPAARVALHPRHVGVRP